MIAVSPKYIFALAAMQLELSTIIYSPWVRIMKNILCALITLIVLILLCFSSEAAEIRAFHNINQAPFKQIFGLPSLDNNPLTEPGQWRLNLITNLSNSYSNSTNGTEHLVNDNETFRGSILVNYGLRRNLQFSVEVPFISHSRGFLDDFIHDWHDFFNMPQNGRTKDNSDQIAVSYATGTATLFNLSETESGLGDIRINTAYSLPWKNRTLIFSTELKLPTGDFNKLTGSGGFDFSLGLMLNDPWSLEKYRLTMYSGVAAIFLDDADGALSDIQKNFAVAGRAGIGWQATEHIQLKLQLDAQSALYDSDLKDLGEPAFQLVTGGSVVFSKAVYLDISVAEDIRTLTAADVAFQLALVATF